VTGQPEGGFERGARWSVTRVATASRSTIAEQVAAGLGGTPKRLPPSLFYDDAGSRLFERICRLDEYYPTRTELAILQRHARRLAAACAPEVTVAELGSGSSEKTAFLLRALVQSGRRVRYVPIDLNETALALAARRLTADLTSLEVHAMAADYEAGLGQLRAGVRGQCLALFLGSSIGNFDPEDAVALLARVHRALPQGALFLLGADMVKDRPTLVRAYDDALGVTAAFNRNLLRRINAELGGEFGLDDFAHAALFDEARSRIEMHLVSQRDHAVPVRALGRAFAFARGETIHTENSYKYTPDGVAALAAAGGFGVREVWTDDRGWFSLSVLAASHG
jgi:dimethylhistidine N-methyltransferase